MHSNVSKPLNNSIARQQAMTRKQNTRIMRNSVCGWKTEIQ